MKIDLPEILPAHIAAQAGHVYEQAMENREGSHAAMCKTWTRLRELLIADAGVRERMAAAGLGQGVKPAARVRRVTKMLRETSPKEARAIDDFVRSLK